MSLPMLEIKLIDTGIYYISWYTCPANADVKEKRIESRVMANLKVETENKCLFTFLISGGWSSRGLQLF